MFSLKPTPKDIARALATRHKFLRKSMKLSQAEMAERSGVSLGSLKRFETTGQISLESLLKLMHFLDRSEEVNQLLLSGEDLSEVEKLFTSENRK